ncbi:MAG: M13 family metallopeptidase [Tissierellia bacterium]|nr:M13 family metallopeptidase [Tissierellia bacterium]
MKKNLKVSIISLLMALSMILPVSAVKYDAVSPGIQKNVVAEVKEKPTQEVLKKELLARLQDDFYEFINGKYVVEEKDEPEENAPVKKDNFANAGDRLKKQLTEIGEEVISDKADLKAGSAEKALADVYKTALDFETRNKVGTGKLGEYLDSVKKANTISEYLKAVAKIHKELGKILAAPDPKDASKHALSMEEVGLPARKDDFQDEKTVEDLKVFVQELLQADGMNAQQSKVQAEKLMKFYQEFANAALDKKEQADVKQTMNFYTKENLQAELTNVNIDEFLKDSAKLGYEGIYVTNPKMLKLINKYLTAENLDLLKDYTRIALLDEYAQYLSKAYSDANAKYYQMEGLSEKEKAWDAAKSLAEMELGEIYAKKYFSATKKAGAEKMVKEILAAYRKNIENLSWMGPESKAEALKKIDTMQIKIGYPEEYKSYAKSIVKSPKEGGSLIDNAVAVAQERAKGEHNKAKEAVDRNVWGMPAHVMNAYYEATVNEIVFPAAMLQAPFYDENAGRATNLGAIGAVIAHEITHAFDDAGSLFDSQGKFRDWWSEKDRVSFNKKAQEYIKFFGNIEVLPGEKVDGELTLGENIADSGGVSVIASMIGDDKQELRKMFISYAKSWSGTTSSEALLEQLKSDEHAPSKVRVNGVLSVTDAFYKAFDVKPGDKMYVAPENRVKMF